MDVDVDVEHWAFGSMQELNTLELHAIPRALSAK